MHHTVAQCCIQIAEHVEMHAPRKSCWPALLLFQIPLLSGPHENEQFSVSFCGYTMSHGNEVLPHDTMRLIQRPCYQQGSLCQDLAGNQTTRGHPDHGKETQTEVVWTCLLLVLSGQNHLARHDERGKKTRQTEKEVGRQHQKTDRPGVHQVPEGIGEQEKMEETGCEIICGTKQPVWLWDRRR